MAKNDYFYALGRRKSSTARVRLQGGSGTITINGKPAEEYLANSKYLLNELEQPFIVIEQTNKYNVSAVVSGGGHGGHGHALPVDGVEGSEGVADDRELALLLQQFPEYRSNGRVIVNNQNSKHRSR